MPIAEIETFLKKPDDYNSGCALYEQYGSSNLMKKQFARGNNLFNRQQLFKELKKISDTSTDSPKVEKFAAATAAAVDPVINAEKTLTDQEYNSLPTEGKESTKLWKEAYKEKNFLRAKLHQCTTDRERLDLSLKILALHDKCWHEWQKLDYWRKHKKWPEIKPAESKMDETPLMDLLRRHSNISSYISRDANNEKKKDKVSQWQEELKQIELILQTKHDVIFNKRKERRTRVDRVTENS